MKTQLSSWYLLNNSKVLAFAFEGMTQKAPKLNLCSYSSYCKLGYSVTCLKTVFFLSENSLVQTGLDTLFWLSWPCSHSSLPASPSEHWDCRCAWLHLAEGGEGSAVQRNILTCRRWIIKVAYFVIVDDFIVSIFSSDVETYLSLPNFKIYILFQSSLKNSF